jgi:hypothetical protein
VASLDEHALALALEFLRAFQLLHAGVVDEDFVLAEDGKAGVVEGGDGKRVLGEGLLELQLALGVQ